MKRKGKWLLEKIGISRLNKGFQVTIHFAGHFLFVSDQGSLELAYKIDILPHSGMDEWLKEKLIDLGAIEFQPDLSHIISCNRTINEIEKLLLPQV